MNTEQLLAKLKQYPVAVIGAAATLVFGIAIYFTMGAPAELRKQDSALETQWSVMDANRTRAVNLDAELAKAKEAVDSIKGKLLSIQNKTANYQYFYDLEVASGATIVNVFQEDSPRASDPAKPSPTLYGVMVVRLELQGSLEQVAAFFDRLYAGERLLRVENYTISSGVGGRGQAVSAGELVRITSTIELLAEK